MPTEVLAAVAATEAVVQAVLDMFTKVLIA